MFGLRFRSLVLVVSLLIGVNKNCYSGEIHSFLPSFDFSSHKLEQHSSMYLPITIMAIIVYAFIKGTKNDDGTSEDVDSSNAQLNKSSSRSLAQSRECLEINYQSGSLDDLQEIEFGSVGQHKQRTKTFLVTNSCDKAYTFALEDSETVVPNKNIFNLRLGKKAKLARIVTIKPDGNQYKVHLSFTPGKAGPYLTTRLSVGPLDQYDNDRIIIPLSAEGGTNCIKINKREIRIVQSSSRRLQKVFKIKNECSQKYIDSPHQISLVVREDSENSVFYIPEKFQSFELGPGQSTEIAIGFDPSMPCIYERKLEVLMDYSSHRVKGVVPIIGTAANIKVKDLPKDGISLSSQGVDENDFHTYQLLHKGVSSELEWHLLTNWKVKHRGKWRDLDDDQLLAVTSKDEHENYRKVIFKARKNIEYDHYLIPVKVQTPQEVKAGCYRVKNLNYRFNPEE